MRVFSLALVLSLSLIAIGTTGCGSGRLSDADITRSCELQVRCGGGSLTQAACEAGLTAQRETADDAACGAEFGTFVRCGIRADVCGTAPECVEEGALASSCLASLPDAGLRDAAAGDGGGSSRPFECPSGRICSRIQVRNTDTVDLLFMIDNSGSMTEEQVNLIDELPGLVAVLASGDRDADGMRDFGPVRSLHVGIVTSDMGAGPNASVPTCGRGLGDDGILRGRSRTTTAPCMATYPSGTFEFDRDTDDPAAFAQEVTCVANTGTGGCGFEQQLEAALKAVTPSSAQPWTRAGYVPPRFASVDGDPGSVSGNADGPNAGFLRPSSALVIFLLTDDEDCSVRDYGLFVTADPRFMSVPLNLRCDTFGDPSMGIVHPVQRYVDGFLGLRRDPALLVFSGIVGIPPSTEPAPGETPDFSAILSNPDMTPRPNAMGTNLEPSCSTMNGVAYPPVRIVQTAAGLSASGAAVALASICSNDFGPAIDGTVAQIAYALGGACLPRALGPAADGRVDCEVFETLPEAGPGVTSECSALPGRVLNGTLSNAGEGPRQVCLVHQVARENISTEAGWYYDDFDPSLVERCGANPRRIAFTSSAPPVPGSEITLACR